MPAQEPVASSISRSNCGALLEPLRLEELALGDELVEALAQLLADALDRLLQRRARRHVVRVGVDADAGRACRCGRRSAGRTRAIDSSSSPKKESRQARSSRWAGQSSSESPRTRKLPRWKPWSLRRYCWVDEVGDHLALVVGWPATRSWVMRAVGLGRADAVDAGDRGDDDDVVALEQRPGGRVAHPVDLLVDLAFLLDVGVGARRRRPRAGSSRSTIRSTRPRSRERSP